MKTKNLSPLTWAVLCASVLLSFVLFGVGGWKMRSGNKLVVLLMRNARFFVGIVLIIYAAAWQESRNTGEE